MDQSVRRWDRLGRVGRALFALAAAAALVAIGALIGVGTSGTAQSEAGHTQLAIASTLGPREFIDNRMLRSFATFGRAQP